MNKTTIVLIGVGVIFVVGGAILYKKVRDIQTTGEKGTPRKKATDKEKAKGDDNFPLKVGSYGDRVRKVQLLLNLTPNGYFDKELETLIYSKFKIKEISETNYNYVQKLPSVVVQNF